MGDVTRPPQGDWLDTWTPPEPRALPDVREALVAQMRSPYEHVGLTRMLQMGKGTLSPRTGDPARDARILLDEEHDERSASGGSVTLLHPWVVDDGELRPLGYKYRLPGSGHLDGARGEPCSPTA